MHRTAYGRFNREATASITLDGNPVSATILNSTNHFWPWQWQSQLELTPGAHQLVASAIHPSGWFTTNVNAWFTNAAPPESALQTYDGAGNLTQIVWKNANGTTNRTRSLSYDAKGRLDIVTETDTNGYGFQWAVFYDPLGRRSRTSLSALTNGTGQMTPNSSISYFDPAVEFLELGIIVDYAQSVWKLVGPDLNGRFGASDGAYVLDGVIPELKPMCPTVCDARGNVLGMVTNGAVVWNASRPTGYGAVPGYRPASLANGANLAQACAWRGRWPDVTGYIWLGARYYDPELGRFVSSDPVWNGRDPNYYSFAGGDPINGFDPDGRCLETAWNFSAGSIKGFSQGFLGFDVSGPANTAEYNGQQFGRNSAGTLAAWLAAKGTIDIDAGTLLMGGSLVLEADSAGTLTIAAGPGFAAGLKQTTQGLAEGGIGSIGLYNYNKLQPLQQPPTTLGEDPSGQQLGDGVQQVNGRNPINSRYAGQTYPVDNLPPDLQAKYPNSVQFKPNGFPNFSPYAEVEVKIPGLTGDYPTDAAKANVAVGLDKTPEGYTWHHVEDGETMQLVPSDLHSAIRHTGGSAVISGGG